MVEGEGNGHALAAEHESALLASTGRTDLVDALHWIAEGRPVSGVNGASILTAVVAAADAGVRGADTALRTAVRSALRSTLDTSADRLRDYRLSPIRAAVPDHPRNAFVAA